MQLAQGCKQSHLPRAGLNPAGVLFFVVMAHPRACSIKAAIAEDFHLVQRSEILTGAGQSPLFTFAQR